MNVSYVIRNKAIIGKYEYDAWGNLSVIAYEGISNDDAYVLNNNPFRYKGYYYDVETQLFYCNSRYYSPELCRFISPDDIEYLDPESINGLNLYCYCKNNPIMYADPSGHFTIAALLISVGLSLAFEFVGDLIDGNGIDHSLREYIGAGVSGLFGGLGGGLGAQIVFSVAGGIADSWISGELNGDNMGQVLFSIGVSTVLSSVAGHLGGKLASKLKGNSLAKLGRHEIKNSMKNMGLKFSLNKNGTSAKAITKFLNKDTSVWLGKIVGEYGMAGTVSGLYSLLPF
jgi:RHS repeat-associated protein